MLVTANESGGVVYEYRYYLKINTTSKTRFTKHKIKLCHIRQGLANKYTSSLT